jgi:squalene-hopene/tetraprenyl-beta-curcumene cyclase
LKEKPGLGVQALYYYYHTFAKALRVYGQAKIIDGQGQSHLWGEDLARELLRRQSDEGSWVNSESSRWWEGNKILVTAEAVMALEEALAPLGLPEDPCPALTVSESSTK